MEDKKFDDYKLAVIDVETNGLGKEADLLEISIRLMDRNNMPTHQQFHSLIKPNSPLCEFSRKESKYDENMFTGIHTQDIVMTKFLAWWKTYCNNTKIAPIGHNYAGFDKLYLQRFFGESNYDNYFHYRIEDTMIMARMLKKAGLLHCKSCGLKYIAEYFQLHCDQYHRAAADTWITGLVYNKLIAILKPNLKTRIVRVFNPGYEGL